MFLYMQAVAVEVYMNFKILFFTFIYYLLEYFRESLIESKYYRKIPMKVFLVINSYANWYRDKIVHKRSYWDLYHSKELKQVQRIDFSIMAYDRRGLILGIIHFCNDVMLKKRHIVEDYTCEQTPQGFAYIVNREYPEVIQIKSNMLFGEMLLAKDTNGHSFKNLRFNSMNTDSLECLQIAVEAELFRRKVMNV